jgi:hypothetical protein
MLLPEVVRYPVHIDRPGAVTLANDSVKLLGAAVTLVHDTSPCVENPPIMMPPLGIVKPVSTIWGVVVVVCVPVPLLSAVALLCPLISHARITPAAFRLLAIVIV